jgi:Tfp pilus assembly protein PilF
MLASPVPSRARPARTRLWLGLTLAAAAALLYLPTLGHAFLNYDDDLYLTRNPHLRLGLSRAGLAWAFTTGYGANWFPLTWLSWLIDYAIWGLDPRGFHLTNLLLHAASTAILFGVLARMTGATLRSAFVAGVFALHPVHVESVAWAAVRKDVLSGLFWMLTLWAYARYAERPSARRYLPVAGGLALGLMAKPMLVTLPFVLLLLDYWPLRRLPPVRAAVVEKVPLLVLSLLGSVVTYRVQHAAGAVAAAGEYPAPVRVLNALLAYATYLRQAFWPSDLAVFYPHRGADMPRAAALAAAVLLLSITAAALKLRARRPYLLVGWLWFVGTLVPVIGLVQVGSQAHADRYLYLPLIGLSIAAAWSVTELVGRYGRRAPLALGAAALAALAFVSVRQVARWRDSVTLFAHAVGVTRDNAVARLNLGLALADRAEHPEARRQLEEAIRLHPGSAEAHGALGEVLARGGRREEAIARFRTALRLDPSLSRVHNGFGRVLLEGGEAEEAAVHFREAVRLDPSYAEAHSNLGVALIRAGSFAEAVEHLREATTLDPASAEAHNNWGVALLNRGELDEAARHFERAAALGSAEARGNRALALARQGVASSEAGRFEEAAALLSRALVLSPESAETHNALGIALGNLGRLAEATDHFRRAVELKPGYAQAHNNWGLALASGGQVPEAVAQFRAAVALDPRYADAHNNLGVFLARQGRLAEATDHFRQALRFDPEHADARVNLRKIVGAAAGHDSNH